MNKSVQPLISVITVCKNSASLLPKTIESMKEQTYEFVEYVVIDGNSKDATHEVLTKYNDSIDICIVEEDDGIYSAMNKGIENSNGEILLFLNAGDYYSSPDVLELFAQKFIDSNADIVYGKMKEVDETGKIRIVGIEKASRYYWFKYTIPHPSIAYRRELFNEFGKYDESYRFAGDYDLNLRFFFNKKINCIYLDKVTTTFLRGGASTNSATKNIVFNERKCIQKVHFSFIENALWSIKLIRKIF